MRALHTAVAAGALALSAGQVFAGGSIKDDFAPTPTYNWSGFYIGGHAGVVTDGGATYTYSGVSNFEPPGRARPNDYDNDFAGGFQIGYLRQFDQFVVGLEGSVTFVDADALLLENPLPAGNDYRTTTDAGEVYAITGRFGLALDRFLPYAKVGYAWTDAEFDASFISGAARTSISNTFDFSGWVYGGGLEYALTNNLSIGVEYLHYDFDSESATLNVTNSGITTERVKADYDLDTLTARLNYKF
jgi:outer membrane immunogenic protein